MKKRKQFEIKKATAVAEGLPFQVQVPRQFQIDAAGDVITLDRLRLVDRAREIAAVMISRGEVASVLTVADALEKEVREAGR